MAVHRLNKYAKIGITGLSIGLCCTCPKIRPQREAFFPSQKRRPCGQSARFVDGSPWIPQRPGVRNPERNATKRGFPQNPRLYYDYVYSLYPTPPLPARLPQRTKGRIRAARAGQKSFMDCLIFFNRLLILSLLSKPAVLCKILVWKAKGAFPGRTTSFLVRQRRSALHQRVVRSRKPALHFLLLRARVQRLRQIEYHSQFGQVNSFTCRKQRPRAKKWRGAFSIRRFRPCGRRIVVRWARRHPVRWP